ncbi:MAG: hypothetical protein ACRDVM_09605, partial [Acidimicrobiia bacterium]
MFSRGGGVEKMLEPADAALARHDPGVPGLALVLDGEALAERLRRELPKIEVGDVRATYVRYKAGTSCLVAYRMATRQGEVPCYARAFRGEDRAKAAKVAGRWASRAEWPAGALLSREAVAVALWPTDT